jgi:hypothetical protein
MLLSQVQAFEIFEGKTMAHTGTRSLHEIKRQTEQTRAGLTDTVDRSSVTETANDIRARQPGRDPG